jgi:hypothetical protein
MDISQLQTKRDEGNGLIGVGCDNVPVHSRTGLSEHQIWQAKLNLTLIDIPTYPTILSFLKSANPNNLNPVINYTFDIYLGVLF